MEQNLTYFPMENMNHAGLQHHAMAMANFIKTEPQLDIKSEPQDMFQSVTSTTAKGKTSKAKKRKTEKVKQEKITDHMVVKKKKHDRFKGMPEEEVMKRLLPDHLAEDLDIVIVGINPGLMAAYVGHHYAGPGNHFWKCMYLSGLIPEPLTAYDDTKLLNYGIGFTNIVARTTRGSADLTRKEIKEGAKYLSEKLNKYKPKIAVFNGKGIYEVFLGHKNFAIGKQPEPLEGTDTVVYVMPSSSARCSQLPRAVDKVPFYAALKKLRDHLRGDLKELDESEVCFPDLELKVIKKEDRLKAEGYPDADNKGAINLGNGNVPAPFTNNQPMNGAVGPPGMNHPGNFMSIKQEAPYNSQDYGGSTNMFHQQMPVISLPCPSYPISSMAYSGGGNSRPHGPQGMMPLPATTYPSSQVDGSTMFGGQGSQGPHPSHFPTSQGSYIPQINCHGNSSQGQGQFLSPGQGQSSTNMFTSQGPSQNLPHHVDLTVPGSYPSAGLHLANAMHGWPGMQGQSCGQSPRPQQGFDQMQNRVFIKAEPQDFGSSSSSSSTTCPFQNVG
ncbi:uncharacterized protein LOC110448845 [Mizuhopecten yessoensis]|uniref:uncharacterized protein LOC110448845 n=1 Tax=Mizuhopecten yessoensis TaxID=6573 RepID=UPI000B45BB2E|nr:uncharacterized protein LOC110448845 [Mizuhopecten yessoensis]XP_021350991.1 uncharacterized protein LOC110448845 [Mizuhopecten yessoensis]